MRQYYVVEFHEDVPWDDRRALLAESGLELRDHPDLVGHHMLVRGTLTQLQALVEWDEVAYVFPASGDLAAGQPLIGCLGAAAPAGQIGQLTQRVGEGWDGPGLGRVDLTYSLQQMTAKLPAAQVEQVLASAMAEWSKHIRVRFQKATDLSARKNINIQFGKLEHGDGFPFDGPGRVLAHAFYPSLPNPEPIAGDLHFDDDERWQIGNEVDVFSVALHELGHSLGLGHSDVPNAVMYPYYRRATALSEEDIAAIRLMYEAGSEPPPLPPPSEPLQPMVLWLHSPEQSFSTSAATIPVRGAVNRPVGGVTVNWTSGALTGTATLSTGANGLSTWSAAQVPVAVGANVIRVEAVDAGGARSLIDVLVTRTAASSNPTSSPGPTTPDPDPPAPPLALTITSPADGVSTSGDSARLTGVARGGAGPYSIRWLSDRGYHGSVIQQAIESEGAQWSVDSLALMGGVNSITVTVRDAEGREVTQMVRIVKTAPSAPPSSPTPGNGDTVPPRVTITSPNTSFLMTRNAMVTLRGIAVDNTAVEQVRWECNCGLSGVASGNSAWTIPNVPLPLGTSQIRVFAKDRAGNEGVAMISFNRYVD